MNLLITACIIITIIMVCTALLSVTVYFFNKLSKDVLTHIEYTTNSSNADIHLTELNLDRHKLVMNIAEFEVMQENGKIKNLKIWQEVI